MYPDHASTPVVNNKHLTRIANESAVTSLRRVSRQNLTAVPDTVEKANDDEERQRRRSQVVIKKRLSNIPSYNSVLNESISEKDANTYAQTCIKLFAENKINTQVAWGLKIIDYLSKLNDSLALAGTSLHVSASVYGLKVDDTHAAGMNLASAVMSARTKEAQEDNADGGEDADSHEDDEQERAKKKNAKKQKRLRAGQNAAIAKDPDSLLSPITKVDSTFFQTQSRADLSTIDNLFTTRFPRDATGWKFSYNFDGNDKAWITPEDPDPIVDDDGADELFPFEMPPLKNFKLCPAFDDFDLAHWNPDEEDKLLNDSIRSFRPNEKPLCFEDGVPVPELDGSIHDIFENGADDAGGGDDDVGFEDHMEEEEIAAGFQGNVEHIVNFKPYESNPRESLMCAQNVEQIWAGPSHWKCKFVRPSVARYTGSLVNTAQTEQQKQKRKRKEKIASTCLDFSAERKEYETTKKLKKKKKPVCEAQLLTLPLPFFNIEPTRALLNKPNVVLENKKSESQEDCEVAPYNYDNPNDSLYCSQNGGDAPSLNGDNDEDLNNGDIAGNDDVGFEENFAENLVQAPQSVPKSYIQYTKQAKRMNMKKLKNAVWTCLTDGKGGDAESDKVNRIREQHFSDMYRILPQHLSDKMRKDLSCPLAFAALLHLCNEHDLELVGQPNLKDVFIRPTQDVI